MALKFLMIKLAIVIAGAVMFTILSEMRIWGSDDRKAVSKRDVHD